MFRLLEWLLFGHVHEWEETGRVPLRGNNYQNQPCIIGQVVYCKCKKCGKPKAFELSV